MKKHVYLVSEQYPSAHLTFFIGDCVRSHSCGFSDEQAWADTYIEGIVLALESWVTENDYLIVKWHTKSTFGVKQVFQSHFDNNTFPISKRSPHLVRLNQMSLPIF
jgi:hypothetical protein